MLAQLWVDEAQLANTPSFVMSLEQEQPQDPTTFFLMEKLWIDQINVTYNVTNSYWSSSCQILSSDWKWTLPQEAGKHSCIGVWACRLWLILCVMVPFPEVEKICCGSRLCRISLLQTIYKFTNVTWPLYDIIFLSCADFPLSHSCLHFQQYLSLCTCVCIFPCFGPTRQLRKTIFCSLLGWLLRWGLNQMIQMLFSLWKQLSSVALEELLQDWEITLS